MQPVVNHVEGRINNNRHDLNAPEPGALRLLLLEPSRLIEVDQFDVGETTQSVPINDAATSCREIDPTKWRYSDR